MAVFNYTARTMSGELKTSTLEAPTRDAAITQLRRQRLAIVKIAEDPVQKAKKGKVKMRDIVIFTRQFATMISAGLPLVQALDILAKQTENKTLVSVVRQVLFD